MKNIHVLPTDGKYSRLYFNVNDKEFQICEIEKPSTILKPNRHVYITSNEQVKVGDWYVNTLDEVVRKNNTINHSYHKKIILTTDQDLIKDGVQAIDDEFLEWFVKNPSCEEVEVVQEKLYEIEHYCDDGMNVGYNNNSTNFHSYKETPIKNWLKIKDKMFYKIIIPSEEPKQETLEEFINSQPYYGSCTTEYLEGIEEGAKWQQERSYSEEEVDVLITLLKQTTEYEVLQSFRDKVEQFKKK